MICAQWNSNRGKSNTYERLALEPLLFRLSIVERVCCFGIYAIYTFRSVMPFDLLQMHWWLIIIFTFFQSQRRTNNNKNKKCWNLDPWTERTSMFYSCVARLTCRSPISFVDFIFPMQIRCLMHVDTRPELRYCYCGTKVFVQGAKMLERNIWF